MKTALTTLILVGLAAGSVAPRAETVALLGGTVHTMGPAGTLEQATVVIQDGRIQAVGTQVMVPSGARRIDVTGKIITPGLMDSFSRLGIVEVSLVPATRDYASDNDRFTAAFSVADAFNPHSTLIPINRVEGLTRAVVAPRQGSSLVAGQGAVVHLGYEAEVVTTPVAMFAVLGAAGGNLAGGSRAGAVLLLREALEDARDFAAHEDDFLAGRRHDYALSRLDLEALGPVVRGELPLVIGVHRAADISVVLDLAEEEGVHLILSGAAEGWMVAGEISAAGVAVLLNPMSNLPESFESLAATLENAARLHAAGVQIAFMSGGAHNARNIKQAAGNAVASGLPWAAALAALTTAPAAIWGIDDDYGTLEAGKDADVVVWDGDPLEVTTFADMVFIKGRQMSMETRQSLLRDRYRDLGGDWPPAYVNP
jgi:imidazolonepropionase-like amidohydrolase